MHVYTVHTYMYTYTHVYTHKHTMLFSLGNHVLRCLEHCQASVGAACHSHNSSRASPVLVACGVPDDVAINALRLSIGRETTETDIDVFVQDLYIDNDMQF